jgi:hypothetical protein
MNTTNIHYDESLIVKEYNEGKSQMRLAKELGTYNTTVRRILLRYGIKMRPQQEVKTVLKGNPFLENSEFSNYFLGYLASDGNLVNRNKAKPNSYAITLNTNLDPQILEIYRKWLNIPNKLRKVWNKKYSVWEYSVGFSSKIVWEYLVSIGITAQKSNTLKFNIPLNRDIIRGVFDGDGCVSYSNKTKGRLNCGCKFSIATNSIQFALQVRESLLHFKPTITYNNGLYEINIYRKEENIKLYHYLYDNATCFLERKKIKFGCLIGETL